MNKTFMTGDEDHTGGEKWGHPNDKRRGLNDE